MKKLLRSKIFIFALLLIVGTIVSYTIFISWNAEDLVYVNKKSMHGNFSIIDGSVIINDLIVAKNKSNKDLYFYMYADISKDEGLAVDKIVPACKDNSFEKEKFFIKAGEEKYINAIFKSKNGVKKTKFNRLPPDKIIFEIVR